jgi:hypothetical protein
MKVTAIFLRVERPVTGPSSLGSTILAILVLLLVAPVAESADEDFQMWFPIQLIHPFGEDWTVTMQSEVRLKDSAHEFSELVLKPGLHYHLNDSWTFSGGYKYQDKGDSSNEQDIWEEISFNQKWGDLVTGYQLRFEQRFIDNISGVIHRARLLAHAAHPIGEGPYYLTGFGAVLFNLNDKNTGPVHGFEQSRIFIGLGRQIGRHTQFEMGYLWRYESERSGADHSDHVLHFGLTFNTKGKDPPHKPDARDKFR